MHIVVCIQVCTYANLCVCVCVHMWTSKMGVIDLPQLLNHLIHRGSVNQIQCPLIWLVLLANLVGESFISNFWGWSYRMLPCPLKSYLGSGSLNCCPQTCMVNTQLKNPLPTPYAITDQSLATLVILGNNDILSIMLSICKFELMVFKLTAFLLNEN